ncbi:MAG TPA: sigma-70 family RNA polymerase sigma factor [Polyangia bacterium]|nr:sigma-70 family RNA polymerase sigma factor [Polyangia bacterium]
MSVPDRDTLAAEHLDLVGRIVATMCRRFGPVVERDDLRSFAMEGLAQAIDRWDPDRGTAFSTFARNRIVGAIYDGVQQSGWFPRRMMRRVAFYRKADNLLGHAAADPPPLDRLESSFRLSCRLRELAAAYVTTASVDDLLPETADHSEPADERLAKQQYFQRLHRLLDGLPEKQRDAIQLYFIEDQRLPEIAERLGCNKSWVSRLIGSGLDRLRVSFSKECAEEVRPGNADQPLCSR